MKRRVLKRRYGRRHSGKYMVVLLAGYNPRGWWTGRGLTRNVVKGKLYTKKGAERLVEQFTKSKGVMESWEAREASFWGR